VFHGFRELRWIKPVLAGDTISFAESNLPAGLRSGSPALSFSGGTAAPGTYNGVVVTATDADGAVLHGTFNLTVDANQVSNYGDEVNRFGNGFDVFRQEPLPGDSPLLALDNVLLTPHVAWVTDAGTQRMARHPVDNILAFLDGRPRFVVNGGG